MSAARIAELVVAIVLLGLLLSCGDLEDSGHTEPETCSCWPVCAGADELAPVLGWLELAELEQDATGAWWCRCGGSSGYEALLRVELVSAEDTGRNAEP
jgi:hypothetical protein